MKKEMLERMHYNQLGVEKTSLRAKEHIFWSGIYKEIKEKVSNCTICLKYQNNNQEETLQNRDLPNRPWEMLTTDLFEFNGKNYLIVVDMYSRFPEVILLNSTTSNSVINHLKEYIRSTW